MRGRMKWHMVWYKTTAARLVAMVPEDRLADPGTRPQTIRHVIRQMLRASGCSPTTARRYIASAIESRLHASHLQRATQESGCVTSLP